MASKLNRPRTLKVGQIEKDPILALGASAKDVGKYGRVAKAYGNVAPAIAGQRGEGRRTLAGQARLGTARRKVKWRHNQKSKGVLAHGTGKQDQSIDKGARNDGLAACRWGLRCRGTAG